MALPHGRHAAYVWLPKGVQWAVWHTPPPPPVLVLYGPPSASRKVGPVQYGPLCVPRRIPL